MRKKIYKIICLLLVVGGLLVYGYSRYPVSYTKFIKKSSKEFGVDPYLIAAMINVESRYDERATSKKDARGLMQITSQTGSWASEVLGLENYQDEILYDPETNIRIGTWYIARLMEEFDGELDLVLAAYNGGSGNVKKWLKDSRYSNDGENLSHIPFEETENYLARVKKNYKIYSRIYRPIFESGKFENGLYICFLHDIRRVFESIFL